jgi:D-alanyl-D-alanine carboxypeptidase
LILITLLVGGIWFARPEPATNQPEANAPQFDKTQFSIGDPTSSWLVVNKKRPLQPKDYEPASLTAPSAMRLAGRPTDANMQVNSEVAIALDQLDADARAADINLKVISAYRSYDTQRMIYDSEVRGFGQAQADRESARPGHSEHQTGWAVDLGAVNNKCEIEACFADTPEGKWLADNAHKYGFIIRYGADQESITGYQYEPWHLRFVGKDLAAELRRLGNPPLEEFFDLPAAPSY